MVRKKSSLVVCFYLQHIGRATINFVTLFQIVIVEYLGKFTKTAKLNWKQWLISVIIAFIRSVDDLTYSNA